MTQRVPPPCYNPRSKAFTLSELLISLTIIGVLSTLVIPKLLQNMESNQRQAVFKETFAVLNDVIYKGIQSGEITSNPADYVLNNLNAAKICKTNAYAQGCRIWHLPWGWSVHPGALMHNGATINLSNGSPSAGFLEIEIDWNGSQGPNAAFYQDVMVLKANTTNVPLGGYQPGRLYSWDEWNPDWNGVYASIWY